MSDVARWAAVDGDQFVLLGGNQCEQVCGHAHSPESVLAWRWTAGLAR